MSVPHRHPRPDHSHQPRGGAPHPDRRSVRVALAAALLRQGRTPTQAAEASQVPYALVAWLADELHGQANQPHADPAAPTEADLDQALIERAMDHPSAPFLQARWRARVTAGITLGWLLDCGLSAAAALHRDLTLGYVAVLLTSVLLATTAATTFRWRPQQ